MVTIPGNITGIQYIRRCLTISCCSPFRQPPTNWKNCVQPSTYLQREAMPSLPWPAMNPDLNSIVHVWDRLDRVVQAVESHVQNLLQLEAALHWELWQQSQHHIWRLTGGIGQNVKALIQARADITPYCTLKHGCRWVTQHWRFWSEMTILSCIRSSKSQYFKWTFIE